MKRGELAYHKTFGICVVADFVADQEGATIVGYQIKGKGGVRFALVNSAGLAALEMPPLVSELQKIIHEVISYEAPEFPEVSGSGGSPA